MTQLKQAGKIANDFLCTGLNKYGYVPVRHTHPLWKHETRKTIFILVLNEFGIKFTSRQDE